MRALACCGPLCLIKAIKTVLPASPQTVSIWHRWTEAKFCSSLLTKQSTSLPGLWGKNPTEPPPLRWKGCQGFAKRLKPPQELQMPVCSVAGSHPGGRRCCCSSHAAFWLQRVGGSGVAGHGPHVGAQAALSHSPRAFPGLGKKLSPKEQPPTKRDGIQWINPQLPRPLRGWRYSLVRWCRHGGAAAGPGGQLLSTASPDSSASLLLPDILPSTQHLSSSFWSSLWVLSNSYMTPCSVASRLLNP